jgi:ABC-type uncharacterized transport system permease subunit
MLSCATKAGVFAANVVAPIAVKESIYESIFMA